MRYIFCCIYLVSHFVYGFTQTELESSEQSTAGGRALSESFSMIGILGQPSAIGFSSGSQFSSGGGFIYTTIDSINTPPIITHSQIESAEIAEDLTVSADINDDNGVSSATLYFRGGGGSNFAQLQMTRSNGNLFEATIPAQSVGDHGVEYFIKTQDTRGLPDREPAFGFYSIQVNIPEPGMSAGNAQPAGIEQNSYRLISIPIDAESKSARAVFEDDLGEYDDTKWRLFELRHDNLGAVSASATQSYAEFPNVSNMNPGTAFWLIVSEPGKIIDTGAGKTNKTSEAMTIDLSPGFTLIGNPFNFPIPASNVTMESGAALDMRFFDGVEFRPFAGLLQPFNGYLVFSNNNDRILINPILTAAPEKVAFPEPNEGLDWSIQIRAQLQRARDTQTLLGVSQYAKSGWDKYDLPEAPVIGDYVSVYFPHTEWQKQAVRYTHDIRSRSLVEGTWQFEVSTNIEDEVRLTFHGLTDIPEDLQVWLLDDLLQMAINLRERNSYSFAALQGLNARNFKVYIGRDRFIDERMDDVQIIPTGFELHQNFPNPFNPVTTIQFALPSAQKITLTIYNLLGESVVTLLHNESREAGYHTVVWNGQDSFGKAVSSGIYVYQLRTEEKNLTKKMALLK